MDDRGRNGSPDEVEYVWLTLKEIANVRDITEWSDLERLERFCNRSLPQLRDPAAKKIVYRVKKIG